MMNYDSFVFQVNDINNLIETNNCAKLNHIASRLKYNN